MSITLWFTDQPLHICRQPPQAPSQAHYRTERQETTVSGHLRPRSLHCMLEMNVYDCRCTDGFVRYPGYPQIPASLQTQVVPGLVSIRNTAENVAPVAGRYSSRIKIESPSAVALAKRAREQADVSCLPTAEVSSPSTKSGDEDSHNGSVCKQLSQVNTKTSPSKSLKSSPSKSATRNNSLKT